jgi:hypothetical protein
VSAGFDLKGKSRFIADETSADRAVRSVLLRPLFYYLFLVDSVHRICERQNALDQFIGKLLLFFKKWEMAGMLKPDEPLLRTLDSLGVLPNQRRWAPWIVSSFKEEDRCAEVRAELSKPC